MRSPESPNEARAAGTSNRPKSGRTGEADPCGQRANLSLPALYGEMLAVATCFVFGGWLGLPAASEAEPGGVRNARSRITSGKIPGKNQIFND